MGTSYGILQGDSSEVGLDEMSNTLQISILNISGEYICSERFTPEQIIGAALEMLKVCSYWTEDGTVEKMITEFKAKEYHW